MKRPRPARTSARIAALAAASAAVVAAAWAGHANASEVRWENVDHFQAVDDYGSPAADTWYFNAYGMPGGEFDTVADDTEPVHHDGSLRLATPGDHDQLGVNRRDSTYDVSTHQVVGPSFADFTGSYLLNVVAGKPAAYGLQLDCPNSAGNYSGAVLSFAGPFADTPGWHTYDVTQDGQALWNTTHQVGSLAPDSSHTLNEYRAQCPDGVIEEHGFRMSVQGSISYVDAVVLDDVATNFQPSPNREMTGTGGADRLVGGPGDDRLSGYGGDDTLIGRDGSDSLWGGKGKDLMRGGDGNDSIDDGTAADVVYGGRGRDNIYLRGGADTVYAGPGRDRIFMWSDGRADRIVCGKGVDLVQYSGGRDRGDRFIGCEDVKPRSP